MKESEKMSESMECKGKFAALNCARLKATEKYFEILSEHKDVDFEWTWKKTLFAEAWRSVLTTATDASQKKRAESIRTKIKEYQNKDKVIAQYA
ncbi:MAG: hypothetical protein ACLUKN_15350 [Bacilli bacterium]